MVRKVLTVVACVSLVAGCSDGAAPGELIGEAERRAAPQVSAETLDGDTLALSEFDGPVVVNFWASWCGPCATEAPALARLDERYAPRGAHVVGVNVRDQLAAASAFERDFGIGYPSWSDFPGEIAAAFGGIGPGALPSTVILDAEHRVAVRLFGAITQEQVAEHLDALLAEDVATPGCVGCTPETGAHATHPGAVAS